MDFANLLHMSLSTSQDCVCTEGDADLARDEQVEDERSSASSSSSSSTEEPQSEVDDDDDDAADGQAATNLEDMHTKARAVAERNFFTAPSKTPRRKWPGVWPVG